MENIDMVLQKSFEVMAKFEGRTIDELKERIKEDWGDYGLRGYGLFNTPDSKAVVICRIDEIDAYENDLFAGAQAEEDGIDLIPKCELINKFPYNAYRFIDTEENREILEDEGALK